MGSLEIDGLLEIDGSLEIDGLPEALPHTRCDTAVSQRVARHSPVLREESVGVRGWLPLF